MTRVFFTSDQHFNHENIIGYTGRKDADVFEMNTNLIYAWNSVVRLGDYVWHLGDFTLGTDAKKFVRQLNGSICFLENLEHHDARWQKNYINDLHWTYDHRTALFPFKSATDEACWLYPSVVTAQFSIYRGKDILRPWVVLSHFPFEEWNRSFHGSIHLHGHSHGGLSKKRNRFDVGVDAVGYAPVLLDDLVV